MKNEYYPEAYTATLFASGFDPDECWLDSDGNVYTLDGDILVGNVYALNDDISVIDQYQHLVKKRLELAKTIDTDKLKIYIEVASILQLRENQADD